jgi:hypothetical protein
MAGRVRLWASIALALILSAPLGAFLGAANADAQSVGAEEAVSSQGAVRPTAGFTPAQKSAIYNEILRQRARAFTARIEPTVGAPVPRSARLAELPAQTGLAGASVLKYAMVADDVVIVDAIEMRVIGVIHRNVGP